MITGLPHKSNDNQNSGPSGMKEYGLAAMAGQVAPPPPSPRPKARASATCNTFLLCILIFVVSFGFLAMYDAQIQRAAVCAIDNQETIAWRNAR